MWPIGFEPFGSSSIVPNTSHPLRSSLPSLIRVVGRSCSMGAIGRRTPVSRSKISSPPANPASSDLPPSGAKHARQRPRSLLAVLRAVGPEAADKNVGPLDLAMRRRPHDALAEFVRHVSHD